MCERCDSYKGPIEIVQTNCGSCGNPVTTYWAGPHGGLLHGNYDLLGDVIFHESCPVHVPAHKTQAANV
jgi:hypothetical protein